MTYDHHKNILNNKKKRKYCRYCNKNYSINSYSSHEKSKMHKNNIKYPTSKQILITHFIKKKIKN